jgi:hypothetical protein
MDHAEQLLKLSDKLGSCKTLGHMCSPKNAKAATAGSGGVKTLFVFRRLSTDCPQVKFILRSATRCTADKLSPGERSRSCEALARNLEYPPGFSKTSESWPFKR